ncbi:MAG TPA: DUF2752 domain-containing protein [Fimbriimonas sp.]|nr:DUF2752 domain-containing protein [Fimbriimonas sp.]
MTLLEPVPSRRSIVWQAIWFVVWVAITAIGLHLHADPQGHGTHQELGLPPCPSALLFDRPCPGCGLTTSWTALLHGDFKLAFSAHPLGPPMYLIYTFSAFVALYGFVRSRHFDLTTRTMSRTLSALAIIFLAFGVTRMILTPHFRTAKEASMIAGLR